MNPPVIEHGPTLPITCSAMLRFITEVLAGGNLGRVDELLAPNFVHLDMGGGDLASVKASLASMSAVVKESRFDIQELVAEGDAVVARYTIGLTLPDGSTISARGITWYPPRRRQDRGGRSDDDAGSRTGVRQADGAAPA
jgi:SnoaL-like domain